MVHWAHRELARDARVNDQELQPRVIKGREQFERHDFYAGADVGNISEILVGWPADRERAVLTIVGNEGVLFLDANHQPIKEIYFSRKVSCPIEESWSTLPFFMGNSHKEFHVLLQVGNYGVFWALSG